MTLVNVQFGLRANLPSIHRSITLFSASLYPLIPEAAGHKFAFISSHFSHMEVLIAQAAEWKWIICL